MAVYNYIILRLFIECFTTVTFNRHSILSEEFFFNEYELTVFDEGWKMSTKMAENHISQSREYQCDMNRKQQAASCGSQYSCLRFWNDTRSPWRACVSIYATCVSFFSKALTNLICHFLVALSDAEFRSDYIPYR